MLSRRNGQVVSQGFTYGVLKGRSPSITIPENLLPGATRRYHPAFHWSVGGPIHSQTGGGQQVGKDARSPKVRKSVVRVSQVGTVKCTPAQPHPHPLLLSPLALAGLQSGPDPRCAPRPSQGDKKYIALELLNDKSNLPAADVFALGIRCSGGFRARDTLRPCCSHAHVHARPAPHVEPVSQFQFCWCGNVLTRVSARLSLFSHPWTLNAGQPVGGLGGLGDPWHGGPWVANPN